MKYGDQGRRMIISHKLKFIFVKTAKTAGTSIEIALSKYCGKDDVITPISHEDEETRRSLGYLGPRNYRKPLWRTTPKDVEAIVKKRRWPSEFYNHMSASEIRAAVGDKVFDEYFVFTFCRDPWRRMVSLYRWNALHIPKVKRLTFKQFLRANPQRIALNWKNYSENDEVIVDKVYRFEDLNNALEDIDLRLGLGGDLAKEMQNVHAKDISGATPAPIEWTDDEIELVRILANEEVERFGYSPPNPTGGTQ